MRPYLIGIVSIGTLLFATSCAGDGTGLPNGGNTDPCSAVADPASTLGCDVQPILTANCALSGCHAGGNPQLGMNLSEGSARQAIVNVPSVEVPTLMRIKPGLPDSSYLVHKIQGTQASVGGSGGQMPFGASPLTQAQVDTIRSWVSVGALNN